MFAHLFPNALLGLVKLNGMESGRHNVKRERPFPAPSIASARGRRMRTLFRIGEASFDLHTHRKTAPSGHGGIGGRFEELRRELDRLQLTVGAERERLPQADQRDVVGVRLLVEVRMEDEPVRGDVTAADQPVRASEEQLHVGQSLSGETGGGGDDPATVHHGSTAVHEALVDQRHLEGKLSVRRFRSTGNSRVTS
uniref:Uncharacterized protein n=1 Tax=Anopheles atroparvus TaxID=41427 RepID=A0A182ISB8_ANOAO